MGIVPSWVSLAKLEMQFPLFTQNTTFMGCIHAISEEVSLVPPLNLHSASLCMPTCNGAR